MSLENLLRFFGDVKRYEREANERDRDSGGPKIQANEKKKQKKTEEAPGVDGSENNGEHQ